MVSLQTLKAQIYLREPVSRTQPEVPLYHNGLPATLLRSRVL